MVIVQSAVGPGYLAGMPIDDGDSLNCGLLLYGEYGVIVSYGLAVG